MPVWKGGTNSPPSTVSLEEEKPRSVSGVIWLYKTAHRSSDQQPHGAKIDTMTVHGLPLRGPNAEVFKDLPVNSSGVYMAYLASSV